MQISMRVLLAACATATVLFPAPLVAEDTAAQRKAREALEQSRESTAQPTAATPAAQQPPPETTAARPVEPAPVATPVQPAAAGDLTAPALAAPLPSSPDEIERAREALRQKMNEPAPQMAPTAAPVVQHPTPEPAAPTWQPAPTAAPTVAAMPGAEAAPAVQTTSQFEAEEAKAVAQARAEAERVALERAERERLQPANAPYRGNLVLPPLQGPPTGLPQAKEEQLKTLLELYRADRLTPQQYHAERAKILAQQ